MEESSGAGRNIDCVLAELGERHDAVKDGDMVAQAEAFAARCHAGQTRKDGVTPYITHPAEVVATLRACSITDESVLAAAWLHDVVEDTSVTLEEVTAEFGERIGLLVDVLTRRGKGKRDRERYHRRILRGERAAQLVKVADLEHNFRSMEYLDEGAQERKLREANEYYLPLKDGLCEEYSCDAMFSTLERRVREHESGRMKDKADTSDDWYDSWDSDEGYIEPQPWWYGGGTGHFDEKTYGREHDRWAWGQGKLTEFPESLREGREEKKGKKADENAAEGLEEKCASAKKPAKKARKKEEPRTYVVVRREWMESERGWGQSPYGYSLHLNEEDLKAFIEEHWEKWPDEVPDWYYGPDWSSSKPFEVDEATYQEIKASKNGIRRG